MGTPCSECGEPLDESSIRPAWLEPVCLARVRKAAILAAGASLGLALLPLMAAGLGLVLPSLSGRWMALAIAGVAVAATLATQTFAGLRLARSAMPKPRRNRLFALMIIRVPLLLIVVLGTMVGLVTHALKLEYPRGDYPGAASLSGGPGSWLSWMFAQGAIVLPAIAAEILLVRAVADVSRSVSDGRPAWAQLSIAFAATSWLVAMAGLIVVVPFGGWVLGPLLVLIGNAVMFACVARIAGLHLIALNTRRR